MIAACTCRTRPGLSGMVPDADTDGRPYRQHGFPAVESGLRGYWYGTFAKAPTQGFFWHPLQVLTPKQRAAVEAYLKNGTERAGAEALDVPQANVP